MRVLARIAPLIVLAALLAFPADPAEVYRAQGKYADAERLAQRVLELGGKAVAPDHPETIPQ